MQFSKKSSVPVWFKSGMDYSHPCWFLRPKPARMTTIRVGLGTGTCWFWNRHGWSESSVPTFPWQNPNRHGRPVRASPTATQSHTQSEKFIVFVYASAPTAPQSHTQSQFHTEKLPSILNLFSFSLPISIPLSIPHSTSARPARPPSVRQASELAPLRTPGELASGQRARVGPASSRCSRWACAAPARSAAAPPLPVLCGEHASKFQRWKRRWWWSKWFEHGTTWRSKFWNFDR